MPTNSNPTRSQPRSNRNRRGGNTSNSNKNRALMRKFGCPFREEATCMHEQEPQKCRFGHPETAPDRDEFKLQDLPHFVCFHYLNGRCNLETSKVRNSNKLSCRSGLHLELSEFAENPEQFEEQNHELIQNFFGPDIDLVCSICLEKVLGKRYARNRRFGILENCNHVFCATCLIAWHQDSKSCPMCRTESRRYVVRAQFIQSPYEKMNIFARTNNSNSNNISSALDTSGRPRVPGNLNSVSTTSARPRVVGNLNTVSSSTISASVGSRVPAVNSNSNSVSLFEQQNLQCKICLENVLGKLLVRKHQFAVLQNCGHTFCSYCVIQLRSNPFRCPECQVESNYFAIAQQWLGQGPLKQQLFHETLFRQGTYEVWVSGHQTKVYSFDDVHCRGPNGLAGYLDDDWFYYVDQLRNRQRNVTAMPTAPPRPTRASSSVSSTNPSGSQYAASSIYPSIVSPTSTTSTAATNRYPYDDHHPSSYASFQSMPSSPYTPQSSFCTSPTRARKLPKEKNCCIS